MPGRLAAISENNIYYLPLPVANLFRSASGTTNHSGFLSWERETNLWPVFFSEITLDKKNIKKKIQKYYVQLPPPALHNILYNFVLNGGSAHGRDA